MRYEPKINEVIADHVAFHGTDIERADLIAQIIDRALAGDEGLWRQLSGYIENAIDLAVLVATKTIPVVL